MKMSIVSCIVTDGELPEIVPNVIGEDQITKTLADLGFSWTRISFPGVKGEKRMTAQKLSELNPSKKYIIRVSKHVSALDQGYLLDTWDCSSKCVYFAWEIFKN